MHSSHFVRVAVIAVLLAVEASAQNNAIPLLYQPLVPGIKAPGSKAFTLTVNGTGFASTAVVNWNGSPRLTEVISNSQVKASISAADVASAKTAWITVTNPTPAGGTSNVVFFPVTRPTAAIAMAIRQPFPGATSVAVGDFNNDGKLDVVWMGPQGLNVSLGNGQGGFEAPIAHSGFALGQLVPGDFNGDGKLDVVGTDGFDVHLLVGNGDGTFTDGWLFTPGTGSGGQVAAADFYQSGSLDLYDSGWGTGRRWFYIMHEGKPGPDYFTSYIAGTAAVGDFNRDGLLDLAIPDLETPGITDVWFGAVGAFRNPAAFPGAEGLLSWSAI